MRDKISNFQLIFDSIILALVRVRVWEITVYIMNKLRFKRKAHE
jgi:hypothetical protein